MVLSPKFQEELLALLDEFVKVIVCVVSTAVALAENEAVGAEFTVMVVALEFS